MIKRLCSCVKQFWYIVFIVLIAVFGLPFFQHFIGLEISQDSVKAANKQPSIVLVVTDDQRWDTLWAMPIAQAELVRRGINFHNGFVVNPFCCPSRTSILTGQYSHSTGVWTNTFPNGGFKKFKDDATIAVALKKAGYRTALIGKYLNEYNVDGAYIPPGWDRWVAFDGAINYYNYKLNIDGKTQLFGSETGDYSTDVLKNEAVAFIKKSQGPLFLFFAPYAPHAPAIPAARHKNTFKNLAPYRPPNYNENDVSDKPLWVQHLSLLRGKERAKIDKLRRQQYQALLAVDEAIGSIIKALDETGRLQNTMIVLISDNGQSWGEHRFLKKSSVYDEDIRVPIVIRYDNLVKTPRTDSRLVLNIDLAPTFSELAGIRMPATDGRSLMQLLRSEGGLWRDDFVVEHGGGGGVSLVPTFCAVRNRKLAYVQYATGAEELYDMIKDPYQLENVIFQKEADIIKTVLRKRFNELCRPLPPGF